MRQQDLGASFEWYYREWEFEGLLLDPHHRDLQAPTDNQPALVLVDANDPWLDAGEPLPDRPAKWVAAAAGPNPTIALERAKRMHELVATALSFPPGHVWLVRVVSHTGGRDPKLMELAFKPGNPVKGGRLVARWLQWAQGEAKPVGSPRQGRRATHNTTAQPSARSY